MDAIRIDPHVKILDADVVRRARSRGLDGLVYAPHFVRLPEIETRAATFSTADFPVIPAREIFTGSWRSRKHLLALDLKDPVPDFITLDGAMRELRRQDAVVLVPHPEFATVSLSETDIDRYRESIHAVETYNPKHLPTHNRRASAIVRTLDVPAFSSSYAHVPTTIGEAWTAFPGVEPTVEAVVDSLRRRRTRSTGRRHGVGHRLRCLAEFSHLFYENSWQKFDRLVLSEMESTHPRHPAYDGAFDAVAVY